MKYILLIIAFVLIELATIGAAYHQIQVRAQKADRYEFELDKLYYGFCQDVKDSGLDHGANYERLCL